MRIAITGHRPNKLGNDYELKSDLILDIKGEIIEILNMLNMTRNPSKEMSDLTLITGMALGIDILFAQIAIENNIPFIAAIPCLNQDKMWIQKSKDLYNSILNNKLCTVNYITSEEYNQSCMQKRNEWMVNNCDILIAVWDGTSGGTKNCIDYAVKKKKQIIYILIKELKEKYDK